MSLKKEFEKLLQQHVNSKPAGLQKTELFVDGDKEGFKHFFTNHEDAISYKKSRETKANRSSNHFELEKNDSVILLEYC